MSCLIIRRLRALRGRSGVGGEMGEEESARAGPTLAKAIVASTWTCTTSPTSGARKVRVRPARCPPRLRRPSRVAIYCSSLPTLLRLSSSRLCAKILRSWRRLSFKRTSSRISSILHRRTEMRSCNQPRTRYCHRRLRRYLELMHLYSHLHILNCSGVNAAGRGCI